jgi:GR25 family glycosyltransferase involved in LPS biosynthesis
MNIIAGSRISRRVAFWVKRGLRDLGSCESLSAVGPALIANDDQIQAAYVINLDRQPARWANFVTEARRQKVDGGLTLEDFCRRIPAVDARLGLPADAVSCVALRYPLEAQYYVDPDPRLLPKIREEAVQVALTKQEIAVALSHIKAWRQMLEDGVRYALFLEDDVFFGRDFPTQLNRTWRELPPTRGDGAKFDMLYLSYRQVDRGAERLPVSPNLVRFLRGYWWLSGYVFSFSGALRILERLPVIGPVDLWVNQLCSELDVYSTPNSIISQRTDIGSDNRYSILPLLSQLGVQSDSSHVHLEKHRGRRPVFCIGFDPFGAHLVDVALSILGYRCCHDASGRFGQHIDRLLESNLPLLFDAYVGVERFSKIFRQLDQFYPESVFLVPGALADRGTLSIAAYQEIASHFVNRRRKLLSLEVGSQRAWRELCGFLSCEVPRVPFPTNAAVALRADSAHVRIPIDSRAAQVLEHDVHPWIVPYARLSAFGVLRQRRATGEHVGSFVASVDNGSAAFDGISWEYLSDSFPSNLAMFRRENITALDGRGFRMSLRKLQIGNKQYSAASLASARLFTFGRFEALLKPAKADGVITAFFVSVKTTAPPDQGGCGGRTARRLDQVSGFEVE